MFDGHAKPEDWLAAGPECCCFYFIKLQTKSCWLWLSCCWCLRFTVNFVNYIWWGQWQKCCHAWLQIPVAELTNAGSADCWSCELYTVYLLTHLETCFNNDYCLRLNSVGCPSCHLHLEASGHTVTGAAITTNSSIIWCCCTANPTPLYLVRLNTTLLYTTHLSDRHRFVFHCKLLVVLVEVELTTTTHSYSLAIAAWPEIKFYTNQNNNYLHYWVWNDAKHLWIMTNENQKILNNARMM